MQWVVKTTKLCNLRCRYCYEWESLADPARMSEGTWEHVLTAIRDYADLTADRRGVDIPVDVIWHGGEPTLFGAEYFRRVVELQGEIFPPEWLERHRLSNCLQTNLYAVRDEHLDVFEECGFELGISVDFRAGARVTAGGGPTEERVRANMRRLEDRNLPFCVITVLAGHTVAEIDEVYAEISALNRPVRLLPLFGGPDARPMEGIAASRPEILAAMMRFFDLWVSGGMTPRVDPFDECVRTVVLKKLGLVRPRQDRELLGNDVFVVDRDGTLSCDAYRTPGRLGNVTESPIADIVDSAVYRDLMREETQLKSDVCAGCAFLGPCDTSPIARNFDSHVLHDCPTEKHLLPMVEAYLETRGLFGDDFHATAKAETQTYLEDRFAGVARF